jgi:tetratricopeptide (TPR) repeat protein
MKSNFLYITILVFLGLNFGELFAQNIVLSEEDNAAFQTSFFEALKQKAIKNYPKAIENLEKCYQIDSSNTAVQFELSKNYFLLKKTYESKIFINKALYKKPKNINLLKQKVAILRATQNFEEAIKIQKKIVKMQPNLSNDLVLLYILNKNFKKAKKLIVDIENKALANSKTKGLEQYLKSKTNSIISETPKENKGENLALGDLLKNYNKTKNYKTLVKIIQGYIKNNQNEALYSLTKSELDLFPTQPYLYYANGLALTNLKKYKEAVAVLLIGIDFVIDNTTLKIEFYNKLATCYTELNQPKEALKYKQKASVLRKE